MRAGHVRFLADALRPDDDVGQLEVDVRERAEQAAVEARRALMAFPDMACADDLVDAVVGQRREQAGDVALVLPAFECCFQSSRISPYSSGSAFSRSSSRTSLI